ncbi:hypothetical protein VTK73DRAFT_6783 [Phialemonium thermophilum]|uniref:Frequency clock protein n=1 Tax=Phialemonium thermophilum TaxID=223376 RepID=A0ABR3Y7V9_9PEZI
MAGTNHDPGSSPFTPMHNRGHPLPRRTAPENSVTLRNHRLARDASMKAAAAGDSGLGDPIGPPEQLSSEESNETNRSDTQAWFDRSNRNPTAAFEPVGMDVDPPFFHKETDSSAEERQEFPVRVRKSMHPSAPAAVTIGPARPKITHSSSADDYRSVIDDLTVENKRLREELRKYRQEGPDVLRKDRLFEIKVHGLARDKRRELEATLRDFVARLGDPVEAPSSRQKAGRHLPVAGSLRDSVSKHASPLSSQSRPADSAYATRSTVASSAAPKSIGTPFGAPSIAPNVRVFPEEKFDDYLQDVPPGLLPHHRFMTEKERKKLVVRRLEQLFTGQLGGRNERRRHKSPSVDAKSQDGITTMAVPGDSNAAREARIQPLRASPKKKAHSRKAQSTSSSGGRAKTELRGTADTDQDGSGSGSGNGIGDGKEIGKGSGRDSGHGQTTSSPEAAFPEQRPTRPRDLDPDRVQNPSENMDYIRHLGIDTSENAGHKKHRSQDVSPDADGWVYLNLLCNLAQLHMVNVTPSFIRAAVMEKSAKFQLSPDGQKVRWRGGTEGTKFSSDSSGENSHKSPSIDDTDESGETDHRKKQKTDTFDGGLTIAPSSKVPKTGWAQDAESLESFHYKPLFVRHVSSEETSFDGGTGSQVSLSELEENSKLGVSSRWGLSGSGSVPLAKKRRRDGAIIFYGGAPFCTDLSGDSGNASPSEATWASHEEQQLHEPSCILQRTPPGSPLRLRPLSEDPAIVSQLLGLASDNDIEEGESDDTGNFVFEFPCCDSPQTPQAQPVETILEPSGLGGVYPEDHFVVVVTTRRRLARQPPTASKLQHRGQQAAVELEYLSGRVRRLNPVPLPEPSIFFPPFRSDSETGDDGEESDIEDGGEDDDDEDSETSSLGLTSQRANPHRSEDTYPDGRDSSWDGNDGSDGDASSGSG